MTGLYTRQLGIFNPADHPDAKVTFIGVGGIGSFAAFGAAKLGIPKITLIDPDTVEPHNQPNQFYSVHDVGYTKVDTLAGYILGEDADQEVIGHPVSYPDGIPPQFSLDGVVVSGLDSMAARKDVWPRIKLNTGVPLYMDARLSGEFIVIYAVDPCNLDDCDKYEEQALFDDDEGEDLSCTARGIIDVGLMVSSILTRALRRHFAGEPIDRITMMNQATLTITKGGWVGD
jgi:sulfur carrier protein ThiS adenylyltransferase